MVLFEIILGITALIFLFVLYRKRSHSYWARRNVPFMKPSLIWGNLDNPLLTKHGLKVDIKNAYEYFKRHGHKHGGIFFTSDPVWIPVDLELIKNILQKDFAHFTSHGLSADPERDPLSGNVFNLDGEDWKFVRSKLSPNFSSGKMKMMFNTLLECGVPMIDHVDQQSKRGDALDVKEILASYTTDVIGSCAFGIDCNSFKDPNSDFRRCGRKVFEPSFNNVLRMIVAFVAPFLRHVVKFKMISNDVEKFFMDLVSGLFEYRKANGIVRNDFIQLFIEMREKAKETGEKTLTLPQITAQAFVFFLGGFETSSSTMTLCLHELAFNQDIQDKLRAEVRETMKKNNGELTYDSIMEMKYMDQVVNETLRKYPIVPFVMRACTKDYRVPDSNATISKGMKVFISTLGIHRDPAYYPNPDKFDPERFSDENKSNIPNNAYIPFGEGPRICIGLRFGLMQTKMGLSMLLNKFKFSPPAGEKYDFHFDPKSFNLCKEGSVFLKIEKM
ncbi:cytochrome P450 [Oryctes borbonicus]|uniref:Cytochrome P450 n=1 Tax=Oryctes borbonicus TaxID=1629725 RepID=A0A0T6B2F9_9SCAR|nr:cytochrome P450 [Oryctes borbonicus]